MDDERDLSFTVDLDESLMMDGFDVGTLESVTDGKLHIDRAKVGMGGHGGRGGSGRGTRGTGGGH